MIKAISIAITITHALTYYVLSILPKRIARKEREKENLESKLNESNYIIREEINAHEDSYINYDDASIDELWKHKELSSDRSKSD